MTVYINNYHYRLEDDGDMRALASAAALSAPDREAFWIWWITKGRYLR